jgi:hypothetical protein
LITQHDLLAPLYRLTGREKTSSSHLPLILQKHHWKLSAKPKGVWKGPVKNGINFIKKE